MASPRAGWLALATVCAVSTAGLVGAQPAAVGGDAARLRRSNFDGLLAVSRGLNDELRKPTPDPASLRTYSARLAVLAPQLPSWFPPGSGPQSGARTNAKALIWTDPAGFRAKATALITASARLDLAARSGDVEAVRAARPAVMAACKSCHDVYEEPF